MACLSDEQACHGHACTYTSLANLEHQQWKAVGLKASAIDAKANEFVISSRKTSQVMLYRCTAWECVADARAIDSCAGETPSDTELLG